MACGAHTLLYVALLSMLPGLEGRYAILLSGECPAALLSAYLSSTTVGILVYLTLDHVVSLLERLSPRLYRLYLRVEKRLAARLRGARGLAALAAFVAAPLPGSGVWSGAIAAKLLGLDWRRAAAGIAVGNLLAILVVHVAKTLGFRLLGF